MAFKDVYNFELLKNQAEQLVIQELEVQIEAAGPDVCRCDECIVDMAAIALNTVKPLYRFSLLGTQYAAAQAMEDPAYMKSIERAVASGIEKVSSNPAHD